MSALPSWSELATVRRARMGHWLQAVGSRAPLAQMQSLLDADPTYQDLSQRWDELGQDARTTAVAELETLLRAAAYRTRPYCLRCGICCTNAGPTLHAGDEDLVRSGRIPRRQLCTYRAGERVYSHWHGRVVELELEHIGVAAKRGRGCSAYDPLRRDCAFYEFRPRQCRAQRCWDTAESDALQREPGVSRQQLLGDDGPELGIIALHDEQCSAAVWHTLMQRLDQDDDRAERDLWSMIQRDRDLRQQLLGAGDASTDELSFFLGRSLEAILQTAGRLLDETEPSAPRLRRRPGER